MKLRILRKLHHEIIVSISVINRYKGVYLLYDAYYNKYGITPLLLYFFGGGDHAILLFSILFVKLKKTAMMTV